MIEAKRSYFDHFIFYTWSGTSTLRTPSGLRLSVCIVEVVVRLLSVRLRSRTGERYGHSLDTSLSPSASILGQSQASCGFFSAELSISYPTLQ